MKLASESHGLGSYIATERVDNERWLYNIMTVIMFSHHVFNNILLPSHPKVGTVKVGYSHTNSDIPLMLASLDNGEQTRQISSLTDGQLYNYSSGMPWSILIIP